MKSSIKTNTDLAVLKPFNYCPAGSVQDLQFSRWLAEFSPRSLLLIVLLFSLLLGFALSQSNYSTGLELEALWRWLPFVVGQHIFIPCVAGGYAQGVADPVEFGLITPAYSVHVRLRMCLVDRNKLRSKSQADYRYRYIVHEFLLIRLPPRVVPSE